MSQQIGPLGSKVIAAGVLALSGMLASGCSGSPGSSPGSSTSPSAPASTPATPGLATLPIKATRSSSYPRLLSASGSGDRRLGTVRVKGGRVFVQTVCSGRGALKLVQLFAQGPCNDQPGVTSFLAPADHEITFVVRAEPGTRWAIYVSQAP